MNIQYTLSTRHATCALKLKCQAPTVQDRAAHICARAHSAIEGFFVLNFN